MLYTYDSEERSATGIGAGDQSGFVHEILNRIRPVTCQTLGLLCHNFARTICIYRFETGNQGYARAENQLN